MKKTSEDFSECVETVSSPSKVARKNRRMKSGRSVQITTEEDQNIVKWEKGDSNEFHIDLSPMKKHFLSPLSIPRKTEPLIRHAKAQSHG